MEREKIFMSGSKTEICGISPNHLKTLGYEIGDSLLLCDAIFMLNSWEEKPQSRMEHAVARELGLDILYESNETNTM